MQPRITTLANGLRVVTDPMPDIASVTLGLWFDVGTRYEALPQAGLSHLIEHMFFKGTATRDALAINTAIENVGGLLNAYTTREQTAYYAKVLKEDAALAMELLADILLNSRFDEADLEREKSVIAQEIGEAYDAPDDYIFDLFHATAYPEQPLGLPVLGEEATLAPLTRADLLAYIKSHYCAGSAVLVAAGAVNADEIEALAEKYFSAMPKGKAPTAPAARYAGGNGVEERDVEQLHLCLGLGGLPYGHKDYYVQALYAMALGGGTSSRLYHEVREKRGLAYTISAAPSPANDHGLMTIYAATEPARAGELLETLGQEIVALGQTISAEELARAKALARAGLLMELESTSARAERLANQVLLHDRIVPLSEILADLEAVSLGDIQAYSAAMLATPLTRAAVGPAAALEDFAQTASRFKA